MLDASPLRLGDPLERGQRGEAQNGLPHPVPLLARRAAGCVADQPQQRPSSSAGGISSRSGQWEAAAGRDRARRGQRALPPGVLKLKAALRPFLGDFPAIGSRAVSDATRILERGESGGSKAAEELLPLVYEELRRLAAARMACEAPDQTLQATALVHEAWLRLGGDTQPTWQNRAHFFAAAGEAMRRILVDKARRRARIRHGGEQERVEFDEVEIAAPEEDERLLAIHEALDELARHDPVKAAVVKLRFFVGLSEHEVAEALGVTERTVERHWAYAKAWLARSVLSSRGQADRVGLETRKAHFHMIIR